MTSHCVIKIDVPNMSSLFQAVDALDEQAYKSEAIIKTCWLVHINGLGEFSIQMCSLYI